MMQVIPMTVTQALKAADGYSSPLNGSMVDVLASEVRRLQAESERRRIALGATYTCWLESPDSDELIAQQMAEICWAALQSTK